MTKEVLKNIEIIYNNSIKQMELDFGKAKTTIQKEFLNVCDKYIEDNRLYPNGFEFVDKHGDLRKIAYALLDQYCEIKYFLEGWGFDDEIYTEEEITKFLNNKQK